MIPSDILVTLGVAAGASAVWFAFQIGAWLLVVRATRSSIPGRRLLGIAAFVAPLVAFIGTATGNLTEADVGGLDYIVFPAIALWVILLSHVALQVVSMRMTADMERSGTKQAQQAGDGDA